MAESVFRWGIRNWQLLAYVVTLTVSVTLSWAKFQTREDVEKIVMKSVQGVENPYVLDQGAVMRVVGKYDADQYRMEQALNSIQVDLGTLLQLSRQGKGAICEKQ